MPQVVVAQELRDQSAGSDLRLETDIVSGGIVPENLAESLAKVCANIYECTWPFQKSLEHGL